MFIFLPINTSLFSHFSHLLHLAPTLLPSHRFSTPSPAFLGISQLSPNYQKPQEPKVGRKSKRPPPSPFKVKGSTFSLQPAVVVLFCMFLRIFCNLYIFFYIDLYVRNILCLELHHLHVYKNSYPFYTRICFLSCTASVNL